MTSLKTAAEFAFHHSGIPLLRRRNRKKLRILMYHRFPAAHAENFHQQCRYIARHYRTITLTEAGRHISSRTPFPDHSMVVTVDDGYRDFYPNAYPALKEFGIPATLFLTTGVLDGLTWFWWDKLQLALDTTPKQSISIAGQHNVPLDSPQAREAALHRIADAMTKIPNSERLALVDNLPALFDITVPASPPEKYQVLRWDEVREMSKHGIDFGAHTVTHPILSRVETTESLRQEMATSRDRIAEELGKPTLHFCYPSGRREDLDGRVKQLAAAAGFQTAVTTEPGLNLLMADLLLLKRVGVDPHLNFHYFARQLAGFRL